MRELQHDFWRNVRNELAAGRQWLDRAVVLSYAVLTGLVVVGFTLLADVASNGFSTRCISLAPSAHGCRSSGRQLLTVAVLWWTQRFAPGAQGSGIPQVVAALDDKIPPPEQFRLVSLRLSLQKDRAGLRRVAGWPFDRPGRANRSGRRRCHVACASLAVPSGRDRRARLDRRGCRGWHCRSVQHAAWRRCVCARAVSRRRSLSHSGLVIVSIVLAGLVAVSAFGNLTYFGELRVQQLSWSLLGPGSAGGAHHWTCRRTVLAPDCRLDQGPARPVLSLAFKISVALCRRLRRCRGSDRNC